MRIAKFSLLLPIILAAPTKQAALSVTVTSYEPARTLQIAATGGGGLKLLGAGGRAQSSPRDTIQTKTPATFELTLNDEPVRFAVVGDSSWVKVEVTGQGGQPRLTASSRAVIVKRNGKRLEVMGAY